MKKSLSSKFENHLKAGVEAYFGMQPHFVIAVSGGADSMALLYLLNKLNYQALAVHINYQKRGEESDLDQELVEQMAFAWGFECITLRPNPDEAKGENFQNWAREQRYAIFRDLKREYKADAILTAHHQDDQVETILQKVLRGSSPSAWRGMKAWNGELFRPLLHFTKEDILNYCEEEAIPYRTDSSNQESDFARNIIRNKLSATLNSNFPGWKQNILALQNQGEMHDSALHFIAQQVFSDDEIDLNSYHQLPDIIKSAVLKQIIDMTGYEVPYSKGQLQELTKIGQLQTGKSLVVEPLTFTRNRDRIQIKHSEAEGEDECTVQIEISKEELLAGTHIYGHYFSIRQEKENADLILDADKLHGPFSLKPWEKGDCFVPLGMKGRQKISDHLTNRKISAHLKEKALVFCASDGTIYAIIYPETAENGEKGAISEKVKIGKETTNYLTIDIN